MKLTIRALALASATTIAAPALAQDPAPAVEATASAETGGVEEIIVTAQKRSERLQDVPIAVTVIGGEALVQRGAVNIENAQYLVPALNFRKSGTSINQSIFLRGVGTSTFSIAGEPSVSTVLDGVVLSRSGEAFTDLVDIERIEVLRGPQGTLFGKNASAGAINIVSRRPTDTFEGYVEGSYFSEDEYRGRVMLNAPLAENIRARFTGFYSEYDGNIRNETTDEQVNGYKRYGVRGVIEADVTDSLQLTLIGDWRRADDDCCAEAIGSPPRTATGAINTTNLGFIQPALPELRGDRTRRVRQNLVTATEEESWGVSLQADLDAGDLGTVTSITAYRDYDNREIRDGDFVGQAYQNLNQLHDDGPQTGDTFSQELRLASPSNEPVEYVVGLYYSRAATARTFTRRDIVCNGPVAATTLVPCTDPAAPPSTTPSGSARFGSTFKNLAAFGQATFNLSDSFRLIGGLRLTYDELNVFHRRVTALAGPGIQPNFDDGVYNGGATDPTTGAFVPGVSNGVPFRANTDNTNLSGRAGVQYDFSRRNTGYFTYSRGYKGPAYNIFFNLTTIGTAVIDDETADAFELGLKNTLADGRLVLNIAGFYAKYSDFQANNPDFVAGVRTTRFTNAGEISTRGVEVDFVAQPYDGFTLSGGVAYTDAKVDSFQLPAGANPADRVPDDTELPYAPKWKASLSADWRIPTGSGVDVMLGAQSAVQSQQLSLFVANPVARDVATIRGYALVDLSAGIADSDDSWRVLLQVKNLFDESFAAAISDGGPGGSFRYIIPREADRYWGVTARIGFGG